MTSVVLVLSLVKLLSEAAVNQAEAGDAMIEQPVFPITLSSCIG